MSGLSDFKARRDILVERLSCRTATAADYRIDESVLRNDIARVLRKLAATISRAIPGGSADRDFGENAGAYGLVLANSDGTTGLLSTDPAT